MAKLKNDKVSFEVDAKTTKAQEAIHQLTKATQALKEQIKEYRREITALTKQEGDHSAEFKRLKMLSRPIPARLKRTNAKFASRRRKLTYRVRVPRNSARN